MGATERDQGLAAHPYRAHRHGRRPALRAQPHGTWYLLEEAVRFARIAADLAVRPAA
ncbi:hypothetical protein [Streptomyces europaeiscabiei]|uniref:hypothetical protein n=1 Tax=Streptomyces europaeiscabiei TaxID=146819 RepID=UPI0038F63600